MKSAKYKTKGDETLTVAFHAGSQVLVTRFNFLWLLFWFQGSALWVPEKALTQAPGNPYIISTCWKRFPVIRFGRVSNELEFRAFCEMPLTKRSLEVGDQCEIHEAYGL